MRTVAQMANLEMDFLKKGVYEWIVKESPVMQFLPFNDVESESFEYTVETALSKAAWLQADDTIPESTGQTEQRTNTCKRLIKDADVDKGKIQMNKHQDVEAIEIADSAKAMAHEFEETFIYGRTTVESETNEFKGILQMIAELESTATTDLDGINNSQVIAGNASSGELALSDLDELIDQVKPGKPDCLLMSRRMRRKLNALSRASGTTLNHDKTDWGTFISVFDGIPVLISDWIYNNFDDSTTSVLDISAYDFTTSRTGGNDNSVIFALKWGEKDVAGVQSGGMQREKIDPVHNKDAVRHRFKWYVGAALYRKYSAAVLTGVLDTAL